MKKNFRPIMSSLNQKELRDFGVLIGTFIALIFGLLLPLLKGYHLPLLPWIIAGVLASLALVFPQSLAPVYQFWMQIAKILAWINSRLILGIIFVIVVTPIALIRRLLNRDSLNRKFDFQVDTYQIPSQKRTKFSMEKPY